MRLLWILSSNSRRKKTLYLKWQGRLSREALCPTTIASLSIIFFINLIFCWFRTSSVFLQSVRSITFFQVLVRFRALTSIENTSGSHIPDTLTQPWCINFITAELYFPEWGLEHHFSFHLLELFAIPISRGLLKFFLSLQTPAVAKLNFQKLHIVLKQHFDRLVKLWAALPPHNHKFLQWGMSDGCVLSIHFSQVQ